MGAGLGLLVFLAPSAVETFIFASGRGAADIGLIRLFPTSKKLSVAFHLSISARLDSFFDFGIGGRSSLALNSRHDSWSGFPQSLSAIL